MKKDFLNAKKQIPDDADFCEGQSSPIFDGTSLSRSKMHSEGQRFGMHNQTFENNQNLMKNEDIKR